MSKKQTPPTTPKSNWKAGLTLTGILALILVVIVPLALLNGSDDRNRPPAADTRHIAAVFFPKNDGDQAVKSEFSFLETCNYEDCKLPVIILDNSGQTYRYLINPYNYDSLSVSPNKRVAVFVGQDGELHTFFNGGMSVLYGMDKDFVGGVTAVKDDGSAVALRTKAPVSTHDPRFYATKDGQLNALDIQAANGIAISCEGHLWRFEPAHKPHLNEPEAQREFAYDWASQSFTPINRTAPAKVNMQQGHGCLQDGKGSFVMLEPASSAADPMTLWTWTESDGFNKDSKPYAIDQPSAAASVLAIGANDQTLWVAQHNGTLSTFSRTTGKETGRLDLGDRFAEGNGYRHYRIAVLDGMAYAIGKSKADPEIWHGVRVNLATMAVEVSTNLPLLTENYLDRFPGQLRVTDRAAMDAWLEAQAKS